MGFIANFLAKRNQSKEAYQQAARDQRILKLLAEGELSGEERELRKFKESERQRRIKNELEFERIKQHLQDKKRNILNSPNIFKDDGPRILTAQNNLSKRYGENNPFFR